MFEKIALILTIIGGINWGFVGALNFNLLSIFSFAPVLISVIEIIIALAACYTLYAYILK